MYVHYTPETKVQAIELRSTGKSVAAISKELNISESTLRHWFLRYSSPKQIANEESTQEISRLTAECSRLMKTIEIIEQSGFLNEVSLQRRLEFALTLYNQNAGYTARELYEALNIAKGTFYYRLNHSAEVSEKERAKYALMLKIHELFEDSNQIFGAEKIRAMLAREGIRVSNKRVSALMREMGLESVRVDAKKQYQLRKKTYVKTLFSEISKSSNQIRFGSVILPHLKSKESGFTSALSSICFLARSSDSAYRKNQVHNCLPQHLRRHTKIVENHQISHFIVTKEVNIHQKHLQHYLRNVP